MASTSRHPELEISNAFEEIAPFTSGRSTERKLPYDVFINHRGPDVKERLATDIYKTLTGMGLRVFLDKEELELGDFLPAEIEGAMHSASLHIAILSQTYAQSPWCLAELSFMLKTGTPIVPVFYHVEPADVRYATGAYAEAFSRYAEKGRYTLQKLQEWKDALNNVTYTVGSIIHNEEDEEGLLKKIVDCVLKVIKNVPFVVANHPIGLYEILIDFERTSLQYAKTHEDVQIMGIWGMGGSGKTTLAKHLYNNKYRSMDRSSFLLDVRDSASKRLLHNKQKKLLEDLGLRGVSIDNIEEGKGIIANRLRSIRVLIILDDVDNSDQLDALVPKKDSLGRGSLIVVTTRELDVLRCWGISSIYKMKSLDPFHAKQLFCWHAFLQPSPLQEFEDLVESFLQVCNGLPLSLKIFGAQLRGILNKEEWKNLLHKISSALDKDIKNRLKISYDVLDDEEKQIFLDTACFFIGEKKTSAIVAWDGSGWNGLHSWGKLLNKCLVELDDDDCIKMHDHLRDLGREIANDQPPFRLWSPQQIDQIINIDKEEQAIAIRGIMATTDESTNKVEQIARYSKGRTLNKKRGSCSMALLCNPARCLLGGKLNSQRSSCSLARPLLELKILHVRGKFNHQVLGDLSRNLVWLRLSHIEQRNLQSLSSLENLRVLELYESWQVETGPSELWNTDNNFVNESWRVICQLEELWNDDSNGPVQLRELVICGCLKFQRFPESIGRLKDLKKIVVEGNTMMSLPEEFCLLQSLQHLKLTNGELLSLPSSFDDLGNLGHLDLSSCKNLSSLPCRFGNLSNLGHLNLSGCENLSSLPSSFGNLRNLGHLNLFGCRNLSSLPSSFGNLSNLEHLNLSWCEYLTFLPNNFGNLKNLGHLNLCSCKKLSSLSNTFGDLRNLRRLNLTACVELRSLPVSFKELRILQYLNLHDCCSLTLESNIMENITKLEYLDFLNCEQLEELPRHITNQTSLRELILVGTERLREIPVNIGQLSKLQKLTIQSKLLTSLPISMGDLSSLSSLEIYNCPKLNCLPDSLGRLKLLENLKIQDLGVKSLPKSVRQLINLQTLEISRCPISELDLGSGLFACLKRIVLESTEVSKISISEDYCPVLETLKLYDNSNLKKIEVLPNTLKSIVLIGSPKLDALPSFALSAFLRVFELKGCYGVEKIQGLEHCTALEELTAHTRWKEAGIESLQRMERLRKVDIQAIGRLAVQGCIQSMQDLKKWPYEEVIVCTRAVPDAAAIINSFDFSNLFVVDCFDDKKMNFVPFLEWPSPARCILLCFVVNRGFSQTSEISLTIQSGPFQIVLTNISHIHNMELEAGKWVWIAVLQRSSPRIMGSDGELQVGICSEGPIPDGLLLTGEEESVVEKGLLVTGEEESIMEAFACLWEFLSY